MKWLNGLYGAVLAFTGYGLAGAIESGDMLGIYARAIGIGAWLFCIVMNTMTVERNARLEGERRR